MPKPEVCRQDIRSLAPRTNYAERGIWKRVFQQLSTKKRLSAAVSTVIDCNWDDFFRSNTKSHLESNWRTLRLAKVK